MSALIDSNLWIAQFDPTHPGHATAKRALRTHLETDLLVPAVVKIEVLHYMRRALDGDFGAGLHAWLAATDVPAPPLDDATLDGAFHLLQRDGSIGARDTAILQHARAHGARLVTADQALADAAQAVGVAVDRLTW